MDAVHQMMLGAIMLGEVKERPARRGFRAGYWVPDSGSRTLAARRSGPLATWQPLVGYTESLGRFRDLCMAIPRFRT
ncbi:hypothetical protein BUH_1463 [Burkholderia pseudomallei Pakistan 9]|nr:hypothetical protein BUH_1463 [Burkholderia pseudomallei Pakistan 9]